MNRAPRGRPKPAAKSGEFVFSAAHIGRGRIRDMRDGLPEAGGSLKCVYGTAGAENNVSAAAVTGCVFFGRSIPDCLDRAGNAMARAHTFNAADCA